MPPRRAHVEPDAAPFAPMRIDGADAGFSFVELLVALTLLLFTVVAVMGLSMTSSFMANSARQNSAMVNAGANYLERVRQLPYASVGTRTPPSGAPTGTLDTSVTTTASYIVTVTPTVTWGRPNDPIPNDTAIKTVTLTITSSKIGGGSPMSYTTSAVIADIGSAACLDPPGPAALVAQAEGAVTPGPAPAPFAEPAGSVRGSGLASPASPRASARTVADAGFRRVIT